MSREEPTGTSLEIALSSTCSVSPPARVLRDVCALSVETGVTGRLSGWKSVERRPATEEGLAYEY